MATAIVNASSAADNAVVAAPGAGYKFRVLGWVLTYAGTVAAKWRSASTDKTGPLNGVAGTVSPSPVIAPAGTAPGYVALFETAENEALNLNLSGAVAVGGIVVYERVPASL